MSPADQGDCYINSGLFFSVRKEGSSATCYNMKELGGHYAKPVTKGQILHDSTDMRYRK